MRQNWSDYITKSVDLDQLESRLNEWLTTYNNAEDGEHIETIDTANLPTFGGAEPGGAAGADGVYSWDETRLLVSGRHDGQPGWEIIDRSDATWLSDHA